VNNTDKEARLLRALQTARGHLTDGYDRVQIIEAQKAWRLQHPQRIGSVIDSNYSYTIEGLPEPLDAIRQAIYVLQYALDREEE